MTKTTPSPQFDPAIEACAECARLYRAASATVGEEEWRQFCERMALRREILLERLGLLAHGQAEPRDAEELIGWRGKFNELTLSLKGLLSEAPGTVLATVEPAETRLVETLGAIAEEAAAVTDDVMEILEEVTAERDALRNLLSGLGQDVIDHDAAGRRLE